MSETIGPGSIAGEDLTPLDLGAWQSAEVFEDPEPTREEPTDGSFEDREEFIDSDDFEGATWRTSL